MRNTVYIIICIMTVCFLAACSERHTAISKVKDFIEENTLTPEKIKNKQFGRLGTTHLLNDSIITSLRQRAAEYCKPGTVYPEYHQGDTLYYILMNYTYEGDTLSHTFYLDQQLEHVVAAK